MQRFDDPGPYVRNAALCAEVTTNITGQVTGLVGLQDRIMLVADQADAQFVPFRSEMKAVVQLVAGAERGRQRTLKFQSLDPAAEPMNDGGTLTIEFPDSESAVASIVVDYGLDIAQEGVYWLDVFIDGEREEGFRLLTRIPLAVEHVPLLPDMAP